VNQVVCFAGLLFVNKKLLYDTKNLKNGEDKIRKHLINDHFVQRSYEITISLNIYAMNLKIS
jgi:hypothetical protein